MNEYSQQIKRELEGFQSASSLWKDPKYSGLSSEMTQIANLSKNVLVSGDKSCEIIDKFFKAANEQY